MRFRWTIKELKEVSDHKLLETLITERQSTCTNVYSPLYKRLILLRANHDNARLIAACPTMYEYIAQKAHDGDENAIEIISALTLDS